MASHSEAHETTMSIPILHELTIQNKTKNKTLTKFLHSVYSYVTSLVKYGHINDGLI